MLNLHIAARVRELRERSGANIKQLAQRAGIPHSNLAQLEKGKRQWLPHHIQAAAAALGVHPRDLLPAPDEARKNPVRLQLDEDENALVEALRRGDVKSAVAIFARLVER